MKPIISIIISNFNGERFIEDCLNSVLLEKSNIYEIIVVENGSKDKSREILETKFKNNSRITVIYLPHNIGAAEGRNIAVANAAGNYLVILCNDAELQPGWSDKIITFFEQYPKAGFAQLKLLKKGTHIYDYAGDYLGPFGFLIERAQSAKDTGQFDQIKKIFSLKIAGAATQREVYMQLNGLDKDYFYMWEETDLTWRGWLAGYETYFLPDVVVEHHYVTEGKSTIYYKNNQVFYRGARNGITTLIKNLQTKNMFTVLPLHLVCWVVLAGIFLCKLEFDKGIGILKGILWNIFNFANTFSKRKIIQSSRKITDDELFSLVGTKRNIQYYINKARAYILGKPY